LGSVKIFFFFFKEINTFIQQGCISIHQIILEKSITVSNEILSSAICFNIDNTNTKLLISEGSCDTEVWSIMMLKTQL